MISVSVCVCGHFTLFALQVAIQVGSLPNLVWWMVMGQWCDLLFGVTVQWPQPFWSTDFKLKYDIFVYFSHWRSQFKLDLNQTLYDEWKQVSDEPYCLVSRSSDHIGSGWLVSRAKIPFFNDKLHALSSSSACGWNFLTGPLANERWDPGLSERWRPLLPISAGKVPKNHFENFSKKNFQKFFFSIFFIF